MLNAVVVLALLSGLGRALDGADRPPPLPDRAWQHALTWCSSARSPIGREEVLSSCERRWLDRARHQPAGPADRHHDSASPRSITTLQWRPKSLLVDGIVRGQDVTLKTTFATAPGVERARCRRARHSRRSMPSPPTPSCCRTRSSARTRRSRAGCRAKPRRGAARLHRAAGRSARFASPAPRRSASRRRSGPLRRRATR